MARYTPSGTVASVPAINAELEAISATMKDTLSRKGDDPNQMEVELDMNSYRILNLGTPEALTDAARLKDVVVTITDKGEYTAPSVRSLINGVVEADVVEVRGYYVQGDGGEGVWERTGNTATPSQHPKDLEEAKFTDSEGNEFELKGTTVNVLSVGAVTDPANVDGEDTTAAIQAAINSFYNIYLPAGKYHVSSLTIPAEGRRIEGDGHQLTILEKIPDTDGHTIYSPYVAGTIDIYLYGFAIDGNRFSYSGDGIHDGIHLEGGASSGRGVIAYDVWITTATGDGWFVGPNRNASNIQYCYGYACGSLNTDSTAVGKGNGIQMDSHSDAYIGAASGWGASKNRSVLIKTSATPVVSECEIFWSDNRANVEFFQCPDFMLRGCNVDGARVAAVRVNGRFGTGQHSPEGYQEDSFIVGNTFKNFKGTGGVGSDGDVNAIELYDSIGVVIAHNQFTIDPSKGDVKADYLVYTDSDSNNITWVGNTTPIEGNAYQAYVTAIANEPDKLWSDRTEIVKRFRAPVEVVADSPSFLWQGSGVQGTDNRKSRIRVEDNTAGDIVWEALADDEVNREVFLRFQRNGFNVFEAILGGMINIETYADVSALPAVGDRSQWSFAIVQDNGSGSPAFALNDGTSWRLNSFT